MSVLPSGKVTRVNWDELLALYLHQNGEQAWGQFAKSQNGEAESLMRATVKYGRAIQHAASMFNRLSQMKDAFDFEVSVDGETIGPSDREYHKALQYLWTYGDQKELVKLATNLERNAENRTAAVKAASNKAGVSINGWIGTVAQPKQLLDEEGDNLNRIAIFMRGKMAQEDILDEFGQKEPDYA